MRVWVGVCVQFCNIIFCYKKNCICIFNFSKRALLLYIITSSPQVQCTFFFKKSFCQCWKSKHNPNINTKKKAQFLYTPWYFWTYIFASHWYVWKCDMCVMCMFYMDTTNEQLCIRVKRHSKHLFKALLWICELCMVVSALTATILLCVFFFFRSFVRYCRYII